MTTLYADQLAKLGALMSTSVRSRVEGPIEAWPSQLLEALYSEHPFLSEFSPVLNVVRSDDRGYMFGYLEFGNEDDPLKIPVIVKEREILPFATFVHDKAILPLTENRVRQLLINQPVSGAMKATDPTISDNIRFMDTQVPNQAFYMGNRYVSTKLSSVRTQDVVTLAKAASAEPYHKTRQMLEQMVDRLAKQGSIADPVRDDPNWSNWHDTFLIEHLGGRNFRVSSTSSYLRKEAQRELTRSELEKYFSSERLRQVENDGYGLIGGPISKLSCDVGAQSTEAGSPGQYAVMSTIGEPFIGSIIPTIVDFTGATLPLQLFYDGERVGLQERIAGTCTGELPSPTPAVEANKEMAFIFDANGSPAATVPFHITGELPTEYGTVQVVETALGDKLKVLQVPDIAAPAQLDEDTYAVPASFILVELGDKRVELVSSPVEMTMIGQQIASPALTVTGSADSYSLKGSGYKVKQASTKRAEFILQAVGASNPAAILKKAEAMGPVTLYGQIPEDQTEKVLAKIAAVKKGFAKFAASRPAPQLLVHVAEEMLRMEKKGQGGEDTVDAILSLGLINPENTRSYIESKDELEEAQKALASLTLASELGYAEIPMDDALAAMRSVEGVLEGVGKLTDQSSSAIL
jgi:hypothetical protein